MHSVVVEKTMLHLQGIFHYLRFDPNKNVEKGQKWTSRNVEKGQKRTSRRKANTLIVWLFGTTGNHVNILRDAVLLLL